ncbi:MAG: hypothetical protein M3O15_03370 [Acidobacteriota bacterium]|nr:hypothetical protein [Acidobacteriota bacterium]
MSPSRHVPVLPVFVGSLTALVIGLGSLCMLVYVTHRELVRDRAELATDMLRVRQLEVHRAADRRQLEEWGLLLYRDFCKMPRGYYDAALQGCKLPDGSLLHYRRIFDPPRGGEGLGARESGGIGASRNCGATSSPPPTHH